MSIPRKGSRKIAIDGEEFIWKIKKHPSHNERHNVGYEIPVQHVNGGQILLVSLGYCRSRYDRRNTYPVTPSLIGRCIKYAVYDGWKFKEKLPPLQKDCTAILKEEAVSLIMKFISYLEQNEEDNSICQQIANGTKSLIDAGEYMIALENMIENINEYKVKLPEHIITFAILALSFYGNYKYVHISKSILKVQDIIG